MSVEADCIPPASRPRTRAPIGLKSERPKKKGPGPQSAKKKAEPQPLRRGLSHERTQSAGRTDHHRGRPDRRRSPDAGAVMASNGGKDSCAVVLIVGGSLFAGLAYLVSEAARWVL